MFWNHLKIKGKILTALLVMTLGTFLGLRLITLYNLDKLGTYLKESTATLIERAVENSKAALEEQAMRELVSETQDQAELTDQAFQRVNALVRLTAELLESRGAVPAGPADAQEAGQILKAVHAGSTVLRSVYVGSASGDWVMWPERPMPPDFAPGTRPWFQKALQGKGPVWYGPYWDAGERVLVMTCSLALGKGEDVDPRVVGADIRVQEILDAFVGGQAKRLGASFLIDGEGRVLIREGMERDALERDGEIFREDLTQAPDPFLQGLGQAIVARKSGAGTYEIGGVRQYVAYAPLPSIGWSIAILVPLESVVDSARDMEKIMLDDSWRQYRRVEAYIRLNQKSYFFIYSALLAGIVLAGVWLSRRITRPILELDAGARDIGGGNLDRILKIGTGDEIEDLAKTFNAMTGDLKVYVENLKETTAAKERIENELQIAHSIQMGLVPKRFPPFPDRSDVDIFARLSPAREVGGDLYDFFFLDETHLVFTVADVSGKGVPASLFMAITRTLLRAKATQGVCANDCMLSMNRELSRTNDDTLFVTLFLGILDTETGALQYCNAGHNLPYLLGSDQCLTSVSGSHGIPLGIFENTSYDQGCLTLAPGDTLLLYTDGIPEAMDEEKRFYGEERLRRYLEGSFGRPLQELCEGLVSDVAAFVGKAPQSDDITVLALSYAGPQGRVPGETP